MNNDIGEIIVEVVGKVLLMTCLLLLPSKCRNRMV